MANSGSKSISHRARARASLEKGAVTDVICNPRLWRRCGCCSGRIRCTVELCWSARILTDNIVVTFWPRTWISKHPIFSALNPDKTICFLFRVCVVLNFHARLAGVLYDIIQRHNLVVPNKVVVGAVGVGQIGDVVAEGEDALELADWWTVRLVPLTTGFQGLSWVGTTSNFTDQVSTIFAFPPLKNICVFEHNSKIYLVCVCVRWGKKVFN